MAESFFASLKGESIDQQPWPTRSGARHAVVENIAWFNGTRLHSAWATDSDEYEVAGKEDFRQVA